MQRDWQEKYHLDLEQLESVHLPVSLVEWFFSDCVDPQVVGLIIGY